MTNRHRPRYIDDADFTTNAPSYYEDLARKEKLIRLLAERIWGYEKILDETLEEIQERFRAWDKNLEDLPEDLKILLQQWLDNGTLDHIINETIFNWKLDTTIFEQFRDATTSQLQHKVWQFTSVGEMKAHSCFSVGDQIKTSGYYEANDGGEATYFVTLSNKTEDNGSVHNLLDGLQANLLGNGIDCAQFGATQSKTLPEGEVNQIFDNWTTYVNNTPHKFFEVKNNNYHIYKPLYIRKSFIGVGKPTFTYRSEGLGRKVSAETTQDGRFSFDVEAVMGINPQTSGDTEDRFTIKNFMLLCTPQDNDAVVSQKIGLYFPQGNGFLLDNVVVIRANESSFVFKENWMCEITRLNSWKTRGTAFEMVGTYTSMTMKNCYAHGFRTRGFNINGAVYSTFQDLGADGGVGANACYAFGSCRGSTIQSLGTEQSEVENIIYIGDFHGILTGVYIQGAKIGTSIINFYADSNAIVDGVFLIDTTNVPARSPNSFLVTSTGTGEGYNLTFKGVKKNILLGGYTATRLVNAPKGRVYFDMSDEQEFYQNNKLGNASELIAKQTITGGYVKFYSDGEFELHSKYNGSQVSITNADGSLFSSPDIEWNLPTLDLTPLEINFFSVVDRSPSNTFTIVRQSVGISSPAQFRILSTTSRDLIPALNVLVKGRWK